MAFCEESLILKLFSTKMLEPISSHDKNYRFSGILEIKLIESGLFISIRSILLIKPFPAVVVDEPVAGSVVIVVA